MADITAGKLRRDYAANVTRARVIETVRAHADVVALVAIMAFAAIIRLWDLGDMALHHDESLHAQFSYYLFDGAGYKHDPLMHGPFLFHASTAMYFLFGDSEATARMLPAIFGTALVGMPWFLRRQIGMRAVLFAAVLLAVSPTILYYARFDRNESWMAVWTLGMVIFIWRYLEAQKPGYLVGLAAMMAFSFASKEVTFITVAIILVFVDIMLAAELAKRGDDQNTSDTDYLLRVAMLAPVAWLIAAAWPLLGANKPFGRDKLPPIGDVMVLVGVLALPQFSAGIQQVPGFHDYGYNAPQETTLRNATVIVLLLMSGYVGMVWKPKVFILCALAFYVPYVLLYTTFFTNTNGFMSGVWGSLDYWLNQHGEKRGNQPLYYYGLMTPLYEFLPMLATFAGGAWLVLKGDSFKRWLVFWLFGAFVGMSIAGEKMPWLEVHIALPMILAAAVIIARATEVVHLDASRLRPTAIAFGLTALAVLMVVDGQGRLDFLGVGDGAMRILGVVLFIGLALWMGITALRGSTRTDGLPSQDTSSTQSEDEASSSVPLRGRRGTRGSEGEVSRLGQAALTIAFAVLLTLTARAALTVAFTNDDTPVEMMVYTQTSHDIVDMRDRIDALAKASGMGYNLPIVVDPTDGYAWPWAWYLRHYHDVRYVTPDSAGYRGPDGAVLLIHQSHLANVDGSVYTQTPYKHRWWFNETYRGLTVGSVVSKLTSLNSLEDLGRFFLYRRPTAGNTGSVDGAAFFPESLAAYDKVSAITKPPAEPVTQSDGRITIGRPGGGRGEFLVPTDVFVDAAGNIWVADSKNNRIQKFDSAGNYISALGRGGQGQGEFNEPWSITVDPEGYVYVADTWNHRIQRFAPDLKPVAIWGQPSVNPTPGPLDLFGPRDIVLAPDGTLWLTDTGNKRLLHFSKTGEPLGSVGTEGALPGQFSEPVGLAFDAQGRLLVADTWNGRIQRFNPDMTPAGSFPAPWTSHEILDKPYLVVLTDGRIVATDPEKGTLILYDANGGRIGEWRPDAQAQPIGVAASPDGGFVYADGRRNLVQVIPASLIPSLFK